MTKRPHIYAPFVPGPTQVAKYWRENYDLSYMIQRDWKTLASSLRGKIHVWVGSMDAYYLEYAAHIRTNS